MTGLLVSVRNAAEAQAALAGGASVIDVKEPDRGALGAADPQIWRQVMEAVGGAAPVSAALGELFAPDNSSSSPAALAKQTDGLAFAKVGLAGAATQRDWRLLWRQTLQCLPPAVSAVAVAYADWRAALSPRPEEIIDAGAEIGCRMLLIDTFDKHGGHLLDHLPLVELQSLVRRASARQMRVVLAGSLTTALIRQLLPLRPALVAVRGAACRGSRCDAVEERLVRELVSIVSADASTVVEAPAA